MSNARVYRRLPAYHNERVVLLFRAEEFPESLSLYVDFGDDDQQQQLTVTRMSGDDIPLWFTADASKDITIRTSTAARRPARLSSYNRSFYGVEVEKLFERPGTYDVRFLVNGTLPGAEAPQRALIIARVDVREKLLDSQLAGGPLVFAQSPVSDGAPAESLVVVRRMIRGVDFSIDFGDGTSHPVLIKEFPVTDLPGWLVSGMFSAPEPFLLTDRSVLYVGQVVPHVYDEPGVYAAVVKSTVSMGDYCEVLTSPATEVHVVDGSKLPLSELLGDDALIVSTPLLAQTGFQAFYLSARNVPGARYTFSFGDGTGQKEGRICSEWPHIDDSNRTVAGRLTVEEARSGSAETAVCISHTYLKPGSYTVRVRVVASPTGTSEKAWNLGGRVTVLPRPTVTSTLPPVTNPPLSVAHTDITNGGKWFSERSTGTRIGSYGVCMQNTVTVVCKFRVRFIANLLNTLVNKVDRSKLPLSELLGDDALTHKIIGCY